MEIYKVSGNESTPDICLDQNRGIFIFNGRSLPENASSIYLPVITWFDEYIKNPNDETLLDIRFDYINSSSIKQLAKLFVLLENIITKGGKLQVRWHFAAEAASPPPCPLRMLPSPAEPESRSYCRSVRKSVTWMIRLSVRIEPRVPKILVCRPSSLQNAVITICPVRSPAKEKFTTRAL